jgi:hypothetical protein
VTPDSHVWSMPGLDLGTVGGRVLLLCAVLAVLGVAALVAAAGRVRAAVWLLAAAITASPWVAVWLVTR